jgi:hypothetical protein
MMSHYFDFSDFIMSNYSLSSSESLSDETTISSIDGGGGGGGGGGSSKSEVSYCYEVK